MTAPAGAPPAGAPPAGAPPAISTLGISAPALQARVLYRDGLVLIIDKPAGLAVHAGPSGGPNLEAAFDALRFGLPRPPALAHRLDRDTSGCLVLGRHPKALRRLGRLFSAGRVRKTYWAVVDGVPAEPHGRIALPLAKERRKTGWRMVVDEAGGETAKPAITEYRVMGSAEGRAWLALSPRTGRTHQLRVHCAAMGWPVVGDPAYGRGGSAAPPGEPLHLHARAISLPLYPAKPPVAATAPLPAPLYTRFTACGWPGEEAPA